MKKIILSAFAAGTLLFGSKVNAQDSTSNESSLPLEFSGSVDAYYRTTLNTQDQGAHPGFGSSFGNGTGFNIGMINLAVAKSGKKSGFVADFVMGPRGDEATFSGSLSGTSLKSTTSALVNQLYVYYKPIEKLTLTLGNFNTFLGYEVISPAANFNYSTSYMFSYGPFSHTGLKADYAITDNLSAMVAVMNKTDEKTGSGLGNNPMYGLQLGYTLADDKGGFWLNYLDGNTGGDGSDSTSYRQIDLTGGVNVTDELYVGINTTYATKSLNKIKEDTAVSEQGFSGIALYVQYALSENFSLGIRGEHFVDRNAFTGAVYQQIKADNDLNTSGSVNTITLTAQYKVGNLTIMPEVRFDGFSELAGSKEDADKLFADGKTVNTILENDKYKKGVSAFTLAAVYAF